MDDVSQLVGGYEGSGTWHDAVGKSGAYSAMQHNRSTATGFEVEFKHDFDDRTVVQAHFAMIWLESGLFRVEIAGAAVGNGYLFGAYCHYHIAPERAIVEVSYRADGDRLEMFGSSTKNAEGHYIAWRETLRQISAEEGT